MTHSNLLCWIAHNLCPIFLTLKTEMVIFEYNTWCNEEVQCSYFLMLQLSQQALWKRTYHPIRHSFKQPSDEFLLAYWDSEHDLVEQGTDNMIIADNFPKRYFDLYLTCHLQSYFQSDEYTLKIVVLLHHPQHNRIQGGRRPLSFLMPTIVRQTGRQCGRSVVLGASAGHRALSGVAQVQYVLNWLGQLTLA